MGIHGSLWARGINPIQVFRRANEEGVAIDGGTGHELLFFLPQMTGGQDLECLCGFDDRANRFLTEEVESTVGVNGRGGVAAVEPFLPDLLARFRLGASEVAW